MAGSDDRTRSLGGDDPDRTRQTGSPGADAGDETRQLDATTASGAAPQAWEASVPVGERPPAGDAATGTLDPDDPQAEEEGRDRRRDWVIGLGGVVGGLVLAVVIALLLTGGDTDELMDPAADERLVALEAENDDLEARVADLEAQLADAEAAAAGADADLDQQRAALDERATSLDARAQALDDREAALDDREAAIAERERAADAGEPPPDGGPGGGLDLPDAEEVEGFFSRLAERIASLFD